MQPGGHRFDPGQLHHDLAEHDLTVRRFNLMLGVNVVGVEHWVGGILEFARLWDQQDPYPPSAGFAGVSIRLKRPARTIFDN